MNTINATTLDRRQMLKALGLTLSGLALPGGCGLPGEHDPHDRPLNFVFILVDDLGWKDLGCFGSTFYETPHIDRLARRGMRFSSAYAACPVCSPTRASIMSGKYPARMATTDYFGAPQPDRMGRHWTRTKPLLPAPYRDHLPLEETTLAEALAEAGYATFFAGKWHLGGEGYFPEDQGFDINKGGCRSGMPRAGYFSPYKNPRLPDGPEGEHLPDRLAEESVRFIEERGGRPFLLYLSFYSVHTPLQARKDLEEKYTAKAAGVVHEGPRFVPEGERKARQVQDHAVYGGMVEAMDAAVGKVAAALERQGLSDSTAVVFMSDNGGLSTSEGSPTSNVPLRAGKGWLYEGGIREPMFIVWPGRTRAGSVCDVPVTSTDFYPTMLEMAGLPQKPGQHVDGVSLVPLLEEAGGIERRALYWHYPHYGNQGGTPGGAVRLGDWKLIEFFEDGRLELYNVRDDIGETHDLAAERPERTARMHSMLKAWRAETGARMPTKNSDAGKEKK
jgi:arylsulfatase A-like enzyme